MLPPTTAYRSSKIGSWHHWPSTTTWRRRWPPAAPMASTSLRIRSTRWRGPGYVSAGCGPTPRPSTNCGRKAAMDLFAPLPSQLMALAVLENFDRIRADRVAQLEHRSRVLADALSAQLPTWRQHPVQGGLVTWVELPEGAASDFARFAARFGVSVAGSREFASSSYVDDHLRLPYTNPPAQIEEAVRRLAAAWAAYEPGMVASPMTSELATASLV
ncbi:MAG: hypothetical protein R2710_16020 [Acidimicrobiales bacterium]